MNQAACLLLYAIAALVVTPAVLTRLTHSGRSPRLGVAAWLGATASALLALTWSAVRAIVYSHAAPVRVLAAMLLITIAVRVAWSLSATMRATQSYRDRQRDGLRLVGTPDPNLNALIVDAPQPMAYCLPGRDNLVVITSAAQAALTGTQLRAVLAHERSHLAGRHHIALTAAYTLVRAMPWLPLFRLAGKHVPMLLEMRADDLAAQAHGSSTVAHAINAMTNTPSPAGSVGAGGPFVQVRVGRLRRPVTGWRRRSASAVTAMVVLLYAAGPYLATIDPWCPHLHVSL